MFLAMGSVFPETLVVWFWFGFLRPPLQKKKNLKASIICSCISVLLSQYKIQSENMVS